MPPITPTIIIISLSATILLLLAVCVVLSRRQTALSRRQDALLARLNALPVARLDDRLSALGLRIAQIDSRLCRTEISLVAEMRDRYAVSGRQGTRLDALTAEVSNLVVRVEKLEPETEENLLRTLETARLL
jgi:hypothetical protein